MASPSVLTFLTTHWYCPELASVNPVILMVLRPAIVVASCEVLTTLLGMVPPSDLMKRNSKVPTSLASAKHVNSASEPVSNVYTGSNVS